MAPNLPHNWVSELPEGHSVERRNLIVQFSTEFFEQRVLSFPEMRYLEELAAESKRGVLFADVTGAAARPIMEALLTASGARRIILFLSLLDLLAEDDARGRLASRCFSSEPSHYMSSTINQVLAYIEQNLASELCEADVADFAGQSITAFSRYFRKRTGMSFVQHVNTLRINRACELLIDSGLSVADICFNVGYNNVSNFNRHFLVQKGVPPSRFRALHQMNLASAA
jgi:AraC-like DNA-binding protein